MSEHTILKRLMVLVRDEICFLDRGYGYDKPKALEEEYQELQASLQWVESKVNELNGKEFPCESV